MAINESTQGVRAAAYKFILKNRKSINPDMTKKDCSNLYSAFIKQTTNQDTSVTRHNFNEMFATWFSLAAAKFEKNLNVQISFLKMASFQNPTLKRSRLRIQKMKLP